MTIDQEPTELAKGPGCDHCRGSEVPGTVLYFGTGQFAELRACSVCGDGRKLADTLIPCVTVGEPDEVPATKIRPLPDPA